jgi:hypothetical protein
MYVSKRCFTRFQFCFNLHCMWLWNAFDAMLMLWNVNACLTPEVLHTPTLRMKRRVWLDRDRLSTRTWEEASNYGSTITLFAIGYNLVLLNSWVSFLNNLTLFVAWRTLCGGHGYFGRLKTYSFLGFTVNIGWSDRLADAPVRVRCSRVLWLWVFILQRTLRQVIGHSVIPTLQGHRCFYRGVH